jgi:hypothetical protein
MPLARRSEFFSLSGYGDPRKDMRGLRTPKTCLRRFLSVMHRAASSCPRRERSRSSAVDTGLVTRWGGGQENPTVEEMRAALAELDTPDMEHPSTWLSDDDGWTVDVYENGLVTFGHEFEDICERRGVTRDEALELWLLLQQGKRDEIKHRFSA